MPLRAGLDHSHQRLQEGAPSWMTLTGATRLNPIGVCKTRIVDVPRRIRKNPCWSSYTRSLRVPQSSRRLSTETDFVPQCLFRIFFVLSVDNFVTAKASDFNKIQQSSSSRQQTFQQESLRIHKIPQGSISLCTWFGTRRPEVQILSPRPFIFKHMRECGSAETRPSGFSAGDLARKHEKDKGC